MKNRSLRGGVNGSCPGFFAERILEKTLEKGSYETGQGYS
ncbi:hypothetical protein CALK_1097 [Chitinivibrio alkaliphilus ACht1]|uniref:Uncharacterized protein n=1 Tax=Chitinivibrio alkaliphilus ACht1 TaxID=1313304 RepID=U7D9W3_9BACT|nr:hypothetical protein CALK_1097 [Chitinivibrio alkaliphilus ACht1]